MGCSCDEAEIDKSLYKKSKENDKIETNNISVIKKNKENKEKNTIVKEKEKEKIENKGILKIKKENEENKEINFVIK